MEVHNETPRTVYTRARAASPDRTVPHLSTDRGHHDRPLRFRHPLQKALTPLWS